VSASSPRDSASPSEQGGAIGEAHRGRVFNHSPHSEAVSRQQSADAFDGRSIVDVLLQRIQRDDPAQAAEG